MPCESTLRLARAASYPLCPGLASREFLFPSSVFVLESPVLPSLPHSAPSTLELSRSSMVFSSLELAPEIRGSTRGVQDRWLSLAALVCSRESGPRRTRPRRTGVRTTLRRNGALQPFPGITRTAILSSAGRSRPQTPSARHSPAPSLSWREAYREAGEQKSRPALTTRPKTHDPE